MRKQTLYCVEVRGSIGLTAARTLGSAQARALRELGTDAGPRVRHATRADVEWVSGMGGHVPEGVARRAK